jgi:hypothetical protein
MSATPFVKAVTYTYEPGVSLDEFSLKRRGDLHLDVSDSCAFCQGRIIGAGLLVVLIRSGCSYVDEEGRGGRGLIK